MSFRDIKVPASVRVSATWFVLLAASLVAVGHDNATLDAIPSAHGGQVRMAGPFHIELVLEKGSTTKKRPILVYLQNHLMQGVSSAGTTATVTITAGASIVAELAPNGPQSLKGSAIYGMRADLTAVVALTASDGQVWSATFMPGAALAH
jgi:hypothetical protein